MVRRILLAGLVAATLAGVGCRHCCKRFGGRSDDLPPGALLAPPGRAMPRGDTIPPPGLPGPTSDLPPASVPEGRNYAPPPAAAPAPQKETWLPDPASRNKSAGDPLLEPPGGAMLDDPAPVGKRAGDLPPSAPPPNRMAANRGVAGVSGFAVARTGVAVGRTPTADGFANLKAAGYKTVVYLHAPAADTTQVKAEAERAGLAFVGLPVSADALKPALARFRELVGSSAARPAFVFDDTGVRAGSLWYLYFRTVENLPDDTAQVRAAPLGLRDATGDEKTTFWLAVQDYLAKR